MVNVKVDLLVVDYVECYGMGIFLGDFLEVKVIDEVYCRERSKDDFLVLGVVKSNVGYLEVVVGVVGLIKIILVL